MRSNEMKTLRRGMCLHRRGGGGTWHLNFQVLGALCQVTLNAGKWGIPEKGYQNAVWKCLFQVPSALQSKVMVQT